MSKYTFDLKMIAEATGLSIHTVRDHKQQGRFDPNDICSTARYLVIHKLANDIDKEIEAKVQDQGVL